MDMKLDKALNLLIENADIVEKVKDQDDFSYGKETE
jgi:hypothetical protein